MPITDAFILSLPHAKWVKTADVIGWLIPLGMTACGLFSASPHLWYETLGRTYVCILSFVLLGSWAMQEVADRYGRRVQGERKRSPPVAKEIWETSKAMYTVACIAVWPAAKYRSGLPMGLRWNMGEVASSWWVVGAQLVLYLFLADFWNYWKHRLLHTRPMFAFHKNHHQFRDPTAFAGFAIHPVDAVMTFCPICLLCLPEAKQWIPAYFVQVGLITALNFYLHCGATFDLLETVIPYTLLNTSGYHNVHHEKVTANYGEVSPLWDWICGTSDEAQQRSRQLRRKRS